MNLPFAKPAKPPARIVVDRHLIEAVLVELDHQRDELRAILALMDSGRTKSAREAIAKLLTGLS